MSMETDHGPDQEPEKYSFYKKKSRMKHLAGKKVLYKISWLVGKGLLFGVAASIGFFCVKTMGRINISKRIQIR